MSSHAMEDLAVDASSFVKKESFWHLGGMTVMQLMKRVWASTLADDVFGRAAQLAYYFFLALFPGLIFVTAILGMFAGPGSQLRFNLLESLGTAVPWSAFILIRDTMNEISKNSSGGKLTFGILLALWTASSGMTAVQDTLNSVYKVKEGRPLWKWYATALLLTMISAALLIVALSVLLGGNALAGFAAAHLDLGPVATWAWKIVQWPLALVFMALIIAITYYLAPNTRHPRWHWVSPGAVVALVGWVLSCLILRVYFHFFTSYSKTYGSLGAVMVLMTWFYVTGAMLLMGAEVNMQIERAIAQANFLKIGKDPREPVRHDAA